MIKIYFFEGRARVEVIRLILAAAHVQHEMVFFDPKEWENHYKKRMPFEGCPVLEMDGKMYGQSIAVASYLAEEYGLNGSSSMDRLIINQLLGLKEETMVLEGKAFLEKDPQIKAQLTKDLYEVQFPRYLRYFTRFIEENSQGKDFILGEKLSMADLCVYAATTTLQQERPDILAKFPEVLRLRDKVSNQNGIREYLHSRKITPI